jgi:hypothetical protein
MVNMYSCSTKLRWIDSLRGRRLPFANRHAVMTGRFAIYRWPQD